MKIRNESEKPTIRQNLVEHINRYGDLELKYVIAFAMGYYKVIDDTVWEVIRELMSEGVIV